VGIEINPLYFVSALVAWVVIYHVVSSFFAIARASSLICWSVGPLGIKVMQLREPPLGQRVAQFVAAAVAMALAVYVSLYVLRPRPIMGLGGSPEERLITVAVPVLLVMAAHFFVVLREHHFPLWGEARVLAHVQRSLATGARVIFTPAGRVFVRERFGATPNEFLRMVR
jgi:hypothetical protein